MQFILWLDWTFPDGAEKFPEDRPWGRGGFPTSTHREGAALGLDDPRSPVGNGAGCSRSGP